MKIIISGVIFFIFAGMCFAHPAESVKMSFDSTGTILTVIVTHPVKNAGNHYIMSIIVDVNGKEQVKQTYASQLDKTEQVAVYKIFEVKKNDKINVTTQCNITGKKKETLVYSFGK